MSTMTPTEGQLTITDGEGNEKLCQILFTLDSEEFGKKYVVFFPVEELNDAEGDGQIALMAAEYIEMENGEGELKEVETDAEWSMLESAVADYENQMDDGCECGEEDCGDECQHGCGCHQE